MKTWYDMDRANLVIDDYLKAVGNPDNITGQFGRTWLEFCMERNGMIQDVRNLRFGDSHALWYAALISTGRVREVHRAELVAGIKGTRSTVWTARHLISGRLRTTVVGQELSQILAKRKVREFGGEA